MRVLSIYPLHFPSLCYSINRASIGISLCVNSTHIFIALGVFAKLCANRYTTKRTNSILVKHSEPTNTMSQKQGQKKRTYTMSKKKQVPWIMAQEMCVDRDSNSDLEQAVQWRHMGSSNSTPKLSTLWWNTCIVNLYSHRDHTRKMQHQILEMNRWWNGSISWHVAWWGVCGVDNGAYSLAEIEGRIRSCMDLSAYSILLSLCSRMILLNVHIVFWYGACIDLRWDGINTACMCSSGAMSRVTISL
jgi:hypothetical protein